MSGEHDITDEASLRALYGWPGATSLAKECDQVPSPGLILQTLSAEGIDGAAYDGELQERQQHTMY